MKNKFLNFLFLCLAFCCFSIQNVKADITDPCVAAAYVCEADAFSGVETITAIISVNYTSATEEWLDCVTFNLPAGWTYVAGSEVGTGSSADGNYVSDTGNSVSFGTAGACPGGDSDYSTLGAGPNDFVFVVTPPAGWSAGDCDTPGDGDVIPGITWDYAGDGYGEAGASSPGTNGGVANPFDINDGADCGALTDAGTLVETTATVCPLTEQATFDVGAVDLSVGCGTGYAVGFDDSAGGTGGLAGGFTLTLGGSPPYSFDADLNGILTANSLPLLGGTWCLTGILTDGFGVACATTTETFCVTYLPDTDAACQPLDCDAVIDAPTAACDGVAFGTDCQVDSEPTPGNTAAFSIFYETDGTNIIDAVSGYTTGDQIFANLNSGVAGEVIFFGEFGDCTGITFGDALTNFSCEPTTLDAYISTIELNAEGNPVNIDALCTVSPVTLVFNPDQGSVTILETAGDCDNVATATVGFDNGDGAGGAPDGDFDDPEDFICGTFESAGVTEFPCGAGENVATVPALAAADVSTLFGDADAACYTDITFTAAATCVSPDCPPCDATAPVLAAEPTVCPDGATSGGPLTLTVTGGSANAGEITEYILTDPSMGDSIVSVLTQADAEAYIAALPEGETVCLTTITHVQTQLDQIIADLNTCAFGAVYGLLGLDPAGGNTLADVFNGIQNSQFGPTLLTIDFVQVLLGGTPGGVGPGLGGTADLGVLIPGLMCPIQPFCYQLSATVCATGVADVVCAVPGCTNPCATNYDETATEDNGTCTLPEAPATACYETATFNDDTCMWDVTGTQDPEPATACYETATFNDVTCVWDVTGTQDPEPATACYETATFNDVTCVWDVSGTQPAEPATACYEMAAFNDVTCVWDVTGTQPAEPATACYETATFNDVTCVWDVTGTQDPEPATACYETATFNDVTCAWDVTGTQDPEPTDLACYETTSFDTGTCAWVTVGDEPVVDDSCEFTDDSYDPATCEVLNVSNCPAGTSLNTVDCLCVTDVVLGCTDPCATNYDPDANSNDGTCTLPEAPATACYETATFNDVTCVWDVTGTQDPEPATACYETATFNDVTCVWDVTGTQDPEPTDLACYETTSFDTGTCAWVTVGDEPVVDDSCEFTDDSYDPATCEVLNVSNCPAGTSLNAANCECTSDPVPGCTDATACNYDANATANDGSCAFATGCDVCDDAGGVTDNPEAGESCDDGDAGTENDIVQADCSCSGTPVMVDVEGCTDATACNFDANATANDGSCVFATGCDVCDGAGGVTDNPEAGDACDDGDANTENDTVQADCTCAGTVIADAVDLDTNDPCGCEGVDLDGVPSNGNEISQETITIIPGLAPYTVVSTTGLVDVTGAVLDAAGVEALISGTTLVVYVPTDGSTYSVTIQDANGSMATQNGGPCPACAPDVAGCINPAACNYDMMATVDDGSCILPDDSCNDGNPLTVNDTVQADCSCAGIDSGEAIPTVGQWGLIILALLMLNLGVLYIRQTEIKIVSE